MTLKKITVFFMALGLVASAIHPANAADAFNPDAGAKPESGGVFQIGETGVNVPFSGLGAGSKVSNDSWTCTSTKDPECDFSKLKSMGGESVFPPCETELQENCIVSLAITNRDGIFVDAALTRSLQGMTFPADKSLNYIAGSTPSIWSAPESPSSSGTTDYMVLVRMHQARYLGEKKFNPKHFIASVVPYREQAGDYKAPSQITVSNDPFQNGPTKSYAAGGHDECVWTEAGKCGVAQDFAAGTRVKLVIRLPKELSGWLQGRLKDPLVQAKSFSETNSELTVEAEPALVQRFKHTIVGKENVSETEKQFVRENGMSGSWDSFTTWANASRPEAFKFIRHFKTAAGDKAAGANTYWNFGSSHLTAQGSPCLSDNSKILGIVTTNSMAYDGGVPKYSRGSLNYKVAGMHLEADGATEVLGSYDLVMRSEVARCLYGFSKAPLSATISISGAGDRTIATTVVSEKNGWLKLAAYGFTFSEKTIKVKLTQKKTTITCVAPGKKSKKVTGFSPKCPKGFKKR